MNTISKNTVPTKKDKRVEVTSWRHSYLWWRARLQQPVTITKVLKYLPSVLLSGFVSGVIILYLCEVFLWGRQVGGAGNLVRMPLLYGGIGMLMSLSFFITCGLPAMYIYPALKRLPPGFYRPLSMCIGFAGGVLGFALPSLLIQYLSGLEIVGKTYLRAVLIFDGALSIVVLIITGALIKLRAEVVEADRLLYESRLNEQVLIERATNAQLRAMQAQINPHFLFNTLSSIATLLNDDPVAAKAMTIRLADIYHYTLRCSNNKYVTLKEELTFVASYLSIEEIRFRDRLSLKLEFPEKLDEYKLPGLLLQPIVENAVKHGIAKNINGGYIRIRIDFEREFVNIAISNMTERPVDLSPERLFVEGHGLKNVKDRINALYGTDGSLNIESEGNEVCVTLRLPIGAGKTR